MHLKIPQNLNYIFDLKGSMINRKVKGETKASTTLKDENFLMATRANEGFTRQTKTNRDILRKAVRCDLAFLR